MIEYEFDIRCKEDSFGFYRWVVSVTASTREKAFAAAQNQVTKYQAEGPCEIWEVIRRKVWPE